jgi:hypothetical protein
MTTLNLTPVQNHLEDLKAFDSNNYVIVEEVRRILFQTFPEIEESVKYNGLMYKTDVGIGGVFTYTNYTSLEFSNGYLLDDKYKQLEGSGKFRRHIKLESVAEVTTKNISYYLNQYLN